MPVIAYLLIHWEPDFFGFWVWVWVWTPIPIVDTQKPNFSSPKTRPEPNLIDQTRVSDSTQTQFTWFYRVRLVLNFLCIRIFNFFRVQHDQSTKNTNFFNRFEKKFSVRMSKFKGFEYFSNFKYFSSGNNIRTYLV